MRLITSVLLLGVLIAPKAYADSDGLFCVGRNYLAYQRGFAAPSSRPFHVFVLTVPKSGSLRAADSLPLPQFQAHGMRCGDGWVELISIDSLYRVVLDERGQPIRYEATAHERGVIPEEFIASQRRNLLGMASRSTVAAPIRIPIGKTTTGNELRLEISAKKVRAPCELDVTSRAQTVSASGRVLSTQILYRGPRYLECGE